MNIRLHGTPAQCQAVLCRLHHVLDITAESTPTADPGDGLVVVNVQIRLRGDNRARTGRAGAPALPNQASERK